MLAVSGLGEFAVICFVYKSAFVGGCMCGLVAKLCVFCGEVLVGGGSWGGVQTLGQAQGDRLAVQSVGLLLRGVSVKDSRCVFAKALCLLQSSACLRLQLWASKRSHVPFANHRLFAVSAGLAC